MATATKPVTPPTDTRGTRLYAIHSSQKALVGGHNEYHRTFPVVATQYIRI